MLHKIIITTAAITMVALAAPSIGTAGSLSGENVQLAAATQQAERKDMSIVQHLRGIRQENRHMAKNLVEMKKKLAEVEKIFAAAKNAKKAEEAKKAMDEIEHLKKDIEIAHHKMDVVNAQLKHGLQTAEQMTRQFEERIKYLEKNIQRGIKAIEEMKKAKKSHQEIEKAVKTVEMNKKDFKQVSDFLKNLKKQLQMVGSA